MKRGVCTALGLWMAILGLLPTSALAELAKVPQLIGHYKTHRAENAADNFMTFLWEHYGALQTTDAGSDTHTLKHRHSPLHDHSRLPFFSAGSMAVAFMPPAPLNIGTVEDPSLPPVPTQASAYAVAKHKLLRPPRA